MDKSQNYIGCQQVVSGSGTIYQFTNLPQIFLAQSGSWMARATTMKIATQNTVLLIRIEISYSILKAGLISVYSVK